MNKLRKLLFLFVFGMIAFLINKSDVYAYPVCRYHIEGCDVWIEKSNGNIMAWGCDKHFNSYDIDSITEDGCPTLYVTYKVLDDVRIADQFFLFREYPIIPHVVSCDTCITPYITTPYISNITDPLWFSVNGVEKTSPTEEPSSTPVEEPQQEEDDNCDESQKEKLKQKLQNLYNNARNKYANIVEKIDNASTAEELEEVKNNALNELSIAYYGTTDESMLSNSNYKPPLGSVLGGYEKIIDDADCIDSTIVGYYNGELSKQYYEWRSYGISKALSEKIDEAVDNGIIDDQQAQDYKNDISQQMDADDNRLSLSTKYYKSWLRTHKYIDSTNDASDCEGLLGPNVTEDIKMILSWIRIAGPILAIVLGALDFAKAVLLDDSKALSKAISTFIKRLIAAVALFFVPLIITYLIDNVPGLAEKSNCNIKELFIYFHIR